MSLIVASIGHELFSAIDIDDLEWPWTPKMSGFSVLGDFQLRCSLQGWIAMKRLDIDQDNLQTGTAKAVACFRSFAKITCVSKLSTFNKICNLELSAKVIHGRTLAHAGQSAATSAIVRNFFCYELDSYKQHCSRYRDARLLTLLWILKLLLLSRNNQWMTDWIMNGWMHVKRNSMNKRTDK